MLFSVCLYKPQINIITKRIKIIYLNGKPINSSNRKSYSYFLHPGGKKWSFFEKKKWGSHREKISKNILIVVIEHWTKNILIQ